MKRELLRRLLEEYSPIDLGEIGSKKQMVKFLAEQENCFERFCEEGHFTGSAWLVDQDNEKVLLMHHAKLHLWCQLGGHCDGEADVLNVALREAQEESGILAIQPMSSKIFDIDIHPIPANFKEKEHLHYDVRFLFRVVSDEKIVKNSESKELRWFGKDCSKLPTDHVSVLRMFKKWLELGRLHEAS